MAFDAPAGAVGHLMLGEGSEEAGRRPARDDAFSRAIEAGFLGSFDQQFEEGLKIVLLGVKAWLGYEEGATR